MMTHDHDVTTTTQVLIVGAGPVGLALACELGGRGIGCVVVEKRDGVLTLPKMSAVSARNMEFCRRWGIAETVRAVWPPTHSGDFVYAESLRGRELARVRRPPTAEWGKLDFTPEGGCQCPQIYFDPILAQHVRGLDSVTLRYHTQLDGFEQDETGVQARVTDLVTPASETVLASYLVGCDGPAGLVRDALGIRLGGLGVVANSVNIFFRSPELASFHDKGWARIYRLIDDTGCWSELIAIDGRELWRLTVFADVSSADAPRQALARMAGGDFACEILSVTVWERRDFVAERFGHRRVLIAGDAAHQCSPTGGLGMHTGLEEAVNLAWKLAARIEGWGGPGLIASYEEERRPIAVRNVGLATQAFNAIMGIPRTAGSALRALSVADRTDWRNNLGRMAASEKQKMEYAYEPSSICVPDAVADRDVRLPCAARPGAAAPHAWLADGHSTLDLFGRGLTLLCFRDGDPGPLCDAAGVRGVPLHAVAIADDAIAALYGTRLVLVRPDGHVAWRGDACADGGAIIDRVRGAASDRNFTQPVPQSAGVAAET